MDCHLATAVRMFAKAKLKATLEAEKQLGTIIDYTMEEAEDGETIHVTYQLKKPLKHITFTFEV